jgi:predicted NUDIX family NTP pyrophosphohydrolase
MVARCSAGILLFRRGETAIEVLLGHLGGPFWQRRDDSAWSIPKGEYEPGAELPLDAARREFREELGVAVPSGVLMPLGEIRQSGGKVVTAWALEADLDPESIVPGSFLLEWPRGSGTMQAFPELDRVSWFGLEAARSKIIAGQRELLDRLQALPPTPR